MKKVMVQFSFPNLDKKMYDASSKTLNPLVKGIFLKGYTMLPLQWVEMACDRRWTSEEAFHRFGETMIPILIKNGGTPAQPLILPVHNIIWADFLN